MNRRLLSFLVCLTLVLGLTSVALAGSYDREDADEAGYSDTYNATADTANAIGKPCYVHGVQFYAGAAGSFVNLYDAATASGTVRIEVSEATAGDSVYYKPAKPIKFDTAVSIDMTGANSAALIEYR